MYGVCGGLFYQASHLLDRHIWHPGERKDRETLHGLLDVILCNVSYALLLRIIWKGAFHISGVHKQSISTGLYPSAVGDIGGLIPIIHAQSGNRIIFTSTLRNLLLSAYSATEALLLDLLETPATAYAYGSTAG